jgi:hypothetical protein
MRKLFAALAITALACGACGGRLADAEDDCGTGGRACDAGAERAVEARCGNGVAEGSEDCDGADLGGASCDSLYNGERPGRLLCSDACRFNTRACRRR